jgi:hypothetical protein
LTAKILTELTDVYLVECPLEFINRDIRLIPMTQVHPNTCGMIAIAQSVEVTVSGCSLENLWKVKFDEQKIGDWLVGCIEAGKFTVCPKAPTENNSKRNKTPAWNSAKLGYLLTTVSHDFIELQRPPEGGLSGYKRLKKGKESKRMKTQSGRGGQPKYDNKSRSNSSMTTAPTQQSQNKLMSGCVVQLLYTFGSANNHTAKPDGWKWTGDWVVTSIVVHDRQVKVRSVLDGSRKRTLPLNSMVRVISPPCLVVEAFRPLSDYKIIADATTALTLVYPVSERKLSDFAFSTKTTTESVILEIVSCKNIQDIQSMLAVMSHRTVFMYVLIQDLLPYRCLALHADTLKDEILPEQANKLETYRTLLEWILCRSQVKLDGPVRGTNWNLYDMHKALSHLNVKTSLVFRIEVPDDNLMASWKSQIGRKVPRDVLASTPVSAGEKLFPSGTDVETIVRWAARKYVNGKDRHARPVTLRRSVPGTTVVRTTVLNGIISRQEVGLEVQQDNAKSLIEAASRVIQLVSTITMPEALHWEAYRFDVALDANNEWFVVHVSSWESEPLFDDLDNELEVKGLTALGGNKTVLLAHPFKIVDVLSNVPPTVAVYKLRDPTSEPHKALLRNDMAIHLYIKTQTVGQHSPLILKMYKGWMSHEELYMTVEAFECNVRAGLNQWQPTFGT